MPWWIPTIMQPVKPVWHSARRYSLMKFRGDALAGLTVAALELPQAMAYAIIAGVPPEYGIYTSIIQGILGALFSSSEHLASGPTNTQSLLIASAATRLAGADAAAYLEIVFGLAMIKGVIQLLFAAGGMGQMVRYVSRSVILGLMAGAGLLIAAGQLPALLGLAGKSEEAMASSPLPGIIGQIHTILPHWADVEPRAMALGFFTIGLTLGCRAISRKLPGAILAVVVCTLAVLLAGWTSGQVKLLGYQAGGLPSFHVPDISWNQAQSMLGGALALAVLGMMESVAIVKSIATQSREKVSANQEFMAQGISNFVSSFFNCMPGSGSFTRSALNHAAGGQTRFAGVMCAGFVASIFFLFSKQVQYVPLACLAGILLVIAFDLIQWRMIWRTAMSSRQDAIVCLATFLATLLAPLEYAIFIGVFLNIGLFVRRSCRLHVMEMETVGPDHSRFIEKPIRDVTGNEPVLFLQMEGDLFFGVADELEDRLTRVSASSARVVIIRLKRTYAIDSSVLHVFEHFIRQMRKQNRHVLLCGVKPELMRQLRAYGLLELLGKQAVFEASHDVFTSARRALQHARTLLGESIDMDSILRTMEPDEWSSYSI